MPTTGGDIPPELIARIRDSFMLDEKFHHIRTIPSLKRNLGKWSLVCKYWAQEFRPLLLHTIAICSEADAEMFLSFVRWPHTESLSFSAPIFWLDLTQKVTDPPWIHRVVLCKDLYPKVSFQLHLQGEVEPLGVSPRAVLPPIRSLLPQLPFAIPRSLVPIRAKGGIRVSDVTFRHPEDLNAMMRSTQIELEETNPMVQQLEVHGTRGLFQPHVPVGSWTFTRCAFLETTPLPYYSAYSNPGFGCCITLIDCQEPWVFLRAFFSHGWHPSHNHRSAFILPDALNAIEDMFKAILSYCPVRTDGTPAGTLGDENAPPHVTEVRISVYSPALADHISVRLVAQYLRAEKPAHDATWRISPTGRLDAVIVECCDSPLVPDIFPWRELDDIAANLASGLPIISVEYSDICDFDSLRIRHDLVAEHMQAVQSQMPRISQLGRLRFYCDGLSPQPKEITLEKIRRIELEGKKRKVP